MAVAMKDNDIEMARGPRAAEPMMAFSSNNQGESFNPMGLEHYSAAAKGDFEKFKHSDSEALAKILTPNGNTILHIHITARPRSKISQNIDFLRGVDILQKVVNKIIARPRSKISQNIDFLRGILGKCSDLLWEVNKKGETLLHMAARYGHADVTKFLLEECKKKPHKNHDDYQELGITPTRRMLQMKSHELGITPTRRMLQMTSHGAKDTALHEAVRYGQLDVVKVLTEADPELSYEANTDGETPLYLAAERGYAEVLKEILKTCTSPADHGPYDRTALHMAVIRKDEDMVERLLQAGERIHKSKQDQYGWTSLHFAAHLGNTEILKKLLGKDNSVAYIPDNKGKTALHVAAGQGRVDIMRELISKCPDCCELVDKRSRNVLHFALESRNKKAVKLVLENPWFGNLINEKDENGNTPFLYAASMGNYLTMLDPRVDMNVFNHQNHNLLDIMLANNSIWLFEMMRPGFRKKCVYYCTKIISRLLEKLLVIQPLSLNLGLRMIVIENDNIGEGKDEGNRVISKCKDGEVEDEGNRMSSKSNGGKVEERSMVNFIEKARQNELVASTLIATVTFAAGFTVPGGYVADKGPDQGDAILSRNTAFRAFVILNTMSMILSSFAVFNRISIGSASIHHQDLRKLVKNTIFGQGLINSSMVAMIGAFVSGTCAVLRNDKSLVVSACVVPVAMLAFLLFYNHLIGSLLLNKYVKN